jgi:hypothetical protein
MEARLLSFRDRNVLILPRILRDRDLRRFIFVLPTSFIIPLLVAEQKERDWNRTNKR